MWMQGMTINASGMLGKHRFFGVVGVVLGIGLVGGGAVARGSVLEVASQSVVGAMGWSVVGVIEAGGGDAPASKSKKSSPSRKATPSRSHPARSGPSKKATPSRSSPPRGRPAAGPGSKSSAKPSSRPSARPSAKSRARPSSRSTKEPARGPSAAPKAKPSSRPSARPAGRPSVEPQLDPKPKPDGQLGVRPGVRPGASGPASRRGIGTGDGLTDGLQPGGDRSVSLGVRQRSASSKGARGVVRMNETPRGFDIKKARESFLAQIRGGVGSGKHGIGPTMDSVDDGLDGGADDGLGDDAGHDDGYCEDDHHDHHGHFDHGYHDDHYFYYTHHSSPFGWWYFYGDYDGDGYTDYVVTNGSYSIYWYGWSGSYWGASPWYGFYGMSGYRRYSWWYYSVPTRYRGRLSGSNDELTSDPSYASAPVDEQAMPEAMPLSALEVARLEMSIGDPGVAVDAYRAHLSEYPSDWIAVRELGLAMIRLGDRGDGVSLVSYAYSMDPTLAYEPVPGSLFEQSDRLLRDAVIDVVGWGHRNPSSSAWLTVAVLMQAEGRDGPGLRMVDRAQDYGLDPAVADAMRSAMAPR